MSTPRPNCKHENSAEHPADRDIKVCPDCFKISQDGGSTWAEGVAAPLEPIRQEFVDNLHREWMAQQNILDFRNWLLARLWDREKEITALRTAQSAVTGTESHWRGRDAAQREKL